MLCCLFGKTGDKALVSPQPPRSTPSGPPAPQTNTESRQDISISRCITITPFSLSPCTSTSNSLRRKHVGVAKNSSPHFHLSHPSMYWPALAHWGGPLAAQQRDVTLEGQDFAILPPPTIPCTHLRWNFSSSLTLHPPPLNSWFALCRSARMGIVQAGVQVLHF